MRLCVSLSPDFGCCDDDLEKSCDLGYDDLIDHSYRAVTRENTYEIRHSDRKDAVLPQIAHAVQSKHPWVVPKVKPSTRRNLGMWSRVSVSWIKTSAFYTPLPRKIA
jgi:hypothetical protein